MHGVKVPANDPQSHLHYRSLHSVTKMVVTVTSTRRCRSPSRMAWVWKLQQWKCNGASPRLTFCLHTGCQPYHHRPTSVNIDQLDKADGPKGVQIYPWGAMSRPSLQHPRGPITTRVFNRVRACTTRRTRPYDALQDRASQRWATICARDAECTSPLIAVLSPSSPSSPTWPLVTPNDRPL